MYPARLAPAILCAMIVVVGCGPAVTGGSPSPAFDPGTEEDRAALFDYLVESTMERDAFASLPDHPYYREHPRGIDVVAGMERFRDELVAADTDSAFYYALLKISNARKDRHLRVSPVDGGLVFPDSFGIAESLANAPVAGSRVPSAPVRLRVDYGEPDDRFLFLADWSSAVAAGEYGPVPGPGDLVLTINGVSADEYREAVRPYHRYSVEDSFWWQLATWIPQRGVQFPRRFYGESLSLTLQRRDGTTYRLDLPYLDPASIEWEGHGARVYPGFTRVTALGDNDTYDLFLSEEPGVPVVLLQWHGFRADLPQAMDRLMDFAEARGLLDHHVIVDATRGRGGSRGAYAVQRLQHRPFRTTFGNLKVSDASERWVEDRIRRLRRDPQAADETTDGGNWLLDWLETDVRTAIAEERRYTNDVPFKLAHLPKWADGIVDPAPVHFRGGLTVWLGPKGGSHLDQFASQVVDNALGHVMGMSAGGYSNTWQYEEVLRFPTTGRPIAGYMWSMGHSIRPNKVILQYNPAEVHEYIPQTRDNYFDYHARLLRRTLERLGLTLSTEASASGSTSS